VRQRLQEAGRLAKKADLWLEARAPFLRRVWDRVQTADVVDRSAALALYVLLASVPVLLLLFSVGGFVLGTIDQVAGVAGMHLNAQQGALAKMADLAGKVLPGVAWNPTALATTLISHRTTNGIIGLVAAISLGATVIVRLDHGIRAVFGLRERSTIRAAGLVLVLLLVACFLGLALSLVAPIAQGMLHATTSLPKPLRSMLGLVASFGQGFMVMLAFAALVRWSAGRQNVGRLLAMGLLFGGVWTFGQRIFVWYVSKVARMDAVYGALSGIIALLMWTYYATTAFLVIVAVLAVWNDRGRPAESPSEPARPPGDAAGRSQTTPET